MIQHPRLTVHRTLLHAPFTPFTVTFCHIIADPANTDADLRLLVDYVETLRSLRHLSQGVAKLHHLCNNFQKIAVLYVGARAHEALSTASQSEDLAALVETSTEPAAREIDDYLSTIGFAPPGSVGFVEGFVNDQSMDANHLTDWLYGKSTLIGLLDRDSPYLNLVPDP